MDERVVTWNHGGFTCKLWQTREGFRGCVFSDGEPIACTDVLARYGEDRAKRAVETLVPVMQRPVGAWDITSEPITDVVLVPRSDHTTDDQGHLDEPFRLAEDLEVLPGERLHHEVIQEACDPPGRNRGFAVDLRGRPLYAFVRSNAPRNPLFTWDSDNRLQICVMLSRLAHPTSISFHYAARIIGDVGAGHYEIVPGPVRGFGAHAWTPFPQRDWLACEDLVTLRRLVESFFAVPFERGSRLAQAMWYFEYAARTELIDVRIPLAATALEALLSTRSDRASLYFKKRLPLLTARLGLPALTVSEAERIWSRRCSLVHGARHGGLGPKDFALATRMEEVLRVTLRQAILDPSLRSDLASPEAVDRAFPVQDPRPREVPCPNCGAVVAVPR